MAKNLNTFLGQYSSVVVNTDVKENETCEVVFSMLKKTGQPGVAAGQDTGHNSIWGGGDATGGTGSPNYYKWDWIVPAGVSQATFHIWGGGGMGAPAYCCMSGVSGGSGAYAYKTVSVTPGDCYRTCFEGYIRYCCTNHNISGAGQTDQPIPYLLHGTRGMKAYVTGTGLTNFCAEGGNPGVTRCGCGWGQDMQNNQVAVQHPGNQCCQLWKICHVVQRRTIDSDNDRYAVAKYYGADGGSKGMYACWRGSCCRGADQNANRCGDRWIIPFPGGLTPNKWAPYGDIELPSVHGGHLHLKNCQIIFTPHGDWPAMQRSQWLGYMCNEYASGQVGVGGLSATACGGGCCCGSPGGVPHLRIEYS